MRVSWPPSVPGWRENPQACATSRVVAPTKKRDHQAPFFHSRLRCSSYCSSARMEPDDVTMRDSWTAMVLAASPPPAAEALPAPPVPASYSRALTPRTSAKISRTVPRQYPREYESRNRSWLATQVWKYFNDSGYETTTALGVVGHPLRAQHKCRCLYCDDIVCATPTKMATHIVSRCQIADRAAKRALCTGKADVLTTSDVANPRPKSRRLECLMVASEDRLSTEVFKEVSEVFPSSVFVEKPHAEIAESPSTLATTTQASTAFSQVLDYVGAFKWESSEISVRSRPSTCLCGENKEIDQTVSLEEAVRQAEEMIFFSTSKRKVGPSYITVPGRREEDVQHDQQERRVAARTRGLNATPCAESRICDATAARRTLGTDKENMPPPSEPRDSKLEFSTAKKRRLENQAQLNPKKTPKVQAPVKKKLFDDGLGDESSEDPQPPSACDVEAMVRGLTMACITENVPIAFLSSARFESTMKNSCGVPGDVDFAQVSSDVLEEMAKEVDAVRDSMKTSSSHLTFVVKRASVSGSYRAVVYLVDESTKSVLISCQQEMHQSSAGCEIDVWLDEVRCHYLKVSEWCGRPLHVCVSDYPTALQHELLEVIDSSTKFARLFGGCMLEEFALLRRGTMKLLRGSPNVVQGCAELALLVNEAERFPLLRRKSNPAMQLSVPEPRGNSVFGYAVLLKQVLLAKEELVVKYQAARVGPRARARKTSDILARVKEILDAIEDEWTVISETLQLLLPFAFVELLKINSVVSLSMAVKLTSGAFFCMELWLFVAVSRSPLLANADKVQWKELLLSRYRAGRMDHQLAGLLLDPRIVGAGLSPVGLRAGRACVVDLCQRLCPLLNTRNLAPQLVDYVNKTGIFSPRKLWLKDNTANPVSFWRGVQDAPELQEIALLVCSYAPASPAASGEVKLPGASSNFDQATRVAQVKHHLQAREVIRDPGSISSHAALELLNFIAPASTAEAEEKLDAGALGSKQALFEPEQFSWRAGELGKMASQQSILQASQVYTMPLRSMIEGAEDQNRASKASMQEASSRSSNFQLTQFSESWIDCSEASLQAIHDAVSCLIAI